LASIFLPTTTKELGESAFSGCRKLQSLSITALTPPTVQSTTFKSVPNETCSLLIPTSSFYDYLLASYWGSFVDIKASFDIEIEDENEETELDYEVFDSEEEANEDVSGDNSDNENGDNTDSTDNGDNSTDNGDANTDNGDNSTDNGDNSTDNGDNSSDNGDDNTDNGDENVDNENGDIDNNDNAAARRRSSKRAKAKSNNLSNGISLFVPSSKTVRFHVSGAEQGQVSVFLNDEDVTDRLVNGYLILSNFDDVNTLKVKTNTLGVKDVKTVDSKIDANTIVDVYNLSGVAIMRGIEMGSIGNLSTGIYIVRSANATKKIIIK
jgi:hypothetical protein